MEDHWTLPIGLLVSQRYELVRELGVGGMGAVYQAFDLKQDLPVAIKFLDPSLVTDEENIIRFQREVWAASRIGHPSICQVLDHGISERGLHYIVMELLKGISLYHMIRDKGPLEPERIIPIVLEVLSGLEYAHRVNIIHRDLKPENIFLVQAPDGSEQVKLLDFGVSRFMDEVSSRRLTKSGKVLGTPLYVSPEQALASRDIDRRADLWGVGVLLYEALTGRAPFRARSTGQMLIRIIKEEAESPRKYKPSISKELERIILKALRKPRSKRYQNAEDFARDLKAL